jgi:RNA polymerase sigma-70 factor (ECF subfamily)
MNAKVNTGSIPALDPEKWVDAYSQMLYRYAYVRTGARHAAEDLVQETFLAALEGNAHFEGRCSVQTWLVSILRHKIYDYIRRRGQNAVTVTEVNPDSTDFFEKGKWKQMPVQWLAEPEKEASKKEFWERFLGCMRGLSPALADAFVLREMELLEPDEICGQLNISDTGLWSRLHRARLNLRRCLEKNWFSKLK